MSDARKKLTDAVRNEFALVEPQPLEPFEAGVAAAIEKRGIAKVPGAHRREKPWSKHVIDVLKADKAAAEQAEARKAAEQSAPPPAPTTAALVRQALEAEIQKLDTQPADPVVPAPVEAPDNDSGGYEPHLPLNGAGLLYRALGGQRGGRF